MKPGDHIDEIKYKILRDKSFEKKAGEFELPPYLRKRNRRFKSIYESMHDVDLQKGSSKHRKHMLKPSLFGHLQYQQFVDKNEIPDNELLAQMLKKSLRSLEKEHNHHHKRQHHYSRSHHKIKRLRSKPEASIMQKKLKI
jgi:hypothetical protein